jgi:hypothetical protein
LQYLPGGQLQSHFQFSSVRFLLQFFNPLTNLKMLNQIFGHFRTFGLFLFTCQGTVPAGRLTPGREQNVEV